jgi:tRNA-specific 2-thiouridylase
VQRGFPHYIIDIRGEFGDAVIDNFVEEYLAGRTPNPCVMCNTHIKWTALLKRADQLGCEYIATGHYAQLRSENNRFIVARGKDLNKDQSYVLWGLTQPVLARTLFPMGNYHKPQIRQMARDWGYHALASKSESYEICFVPENNYRDFLRHRVKDLDEKMEGGKFVNTEGVAIGEHEGYPFYTIGQRKGLGKAFGKPMFVTAIDATRNQVVLGEEEDLMRSAMHVGKLNLIKYESLTDGTEAIVKIRYKDEGTAAKLYAEEGRMRVAFYRPVKAVAPGQSAVFYEGNDVLGGGIIQNSLTA